MHAVAAFVPGEPRHTQTCACADDHAIRVRHSYACLQSEQVARFKSSDAERRRGKIIDHAQPGNREAPGKIVFFDTPWKIGEARHTILNGACHRDATRAHIGCMRHHLGLIEKLLQNSLEAGVLAARIHFAHDNARAHFVADRQRELAMSAADIGGDDDALCASHDSTSCR
jgi:hypothetical protein